MQCHLISFVIFVTCRWYEDLAYRNRHRSVKPNLVVMLFLPKCLTHSILLGRKLCEFLPPSTCVFTVTLTLHQTKLAERIMDFDNVSPLIVSNF